MGFADINALHPLSATRTRRRPVKAVFIVYNRPPYAIVGRKSRGITDPKSLEGKRLGAPPLTSTIQEWPVFAKLNEVEAQQGDARTNCGSGADPDARRRPARCRARAIRSGCILISRTAAFRSATSSSCRCRTTR